MAKDYYVLLVSEAEERQEPLAVLEFSAYEVEVAERFAQRSAIEHPGNTYEVVWRRSAFQFPAER